MNGIGELLYQVSTTLLVPVVALLLGLLALSLVAFGVLLREALERRTAGARWRTFQRTLTAPEARPEPAHAFFDARGWPGLLERFALRARDILREPAHLDAIADECEIEGSRRVARASLLSRAGPTLGLMGTLIPMGPALVAMAQGDVASLARSLVVAFTTTVIGLLIGLLGMLSASVRRHWYASDLAAIQHLVACLARDTEARP